MEHEQKRLGVTGTLQWKPSDATEFSLDALYSKIDATRDEHYIEAISFSRNRDSATGALRRPDRDGKPSMIVKNGV
ncbi:TonB-dependent receptor, partial [Mycobacterium tuberculosis]